jgi:type II secretory pathway component PulJ
MRSVLSKNDGYTVIELIVAIQLSLIVIGLVYVSYLFLSNMLGRWQDKIQRESLLASISQNISKDLSEAVRILEADPQKMVFIKTGGDTIGYYLNDNLYINGKPLENKALKFSLGKLDYFTAPSSSSTQLQKRDQVEVQNLDKIQIVETELEFRQGEKSYHIDISERLLKLRRSILEH